MDTFFIMQVVSSLIHLSGKLQFIDNNGGEESALHMQSFSQAVLNKGLSIIFEGNSGRYLQYTHIRHARNIIFCTFVMLWCCS